MNLYSLATVINSGGSVEMSDNRLNFQYVFSSIILLFYAVICFDLQAQDLSTNSVKAALPEGLPLWAYGYKATPTVTVDYRARCAVGRPIDCIRTTAPGEEEKLSQEYRLEGSQESFTMGEVWNFYGPADWYPQDHPPAPDIVAFGREGDGIPACAMCHMHNGQGLMQNGSVIGLSEEYILRQLHEFNAGLRESSDTNKSNSYAMAAIGRKLTEEDMQTAAAYYSKIKPQKWVEVVESDVVPQFKASTNGLFTKVSDETGPLGERLIEMPKDAFEATRLRSPRGQWIAYTPVGSLERGKLLVETGSTIENGETVFGRTIPCAACHGGDMRGSFLGPTIAGRSPSYLARQMFDFQSGSRAGEKAVLMIPTLQNLTNNDVIAIVAYISSLDP
jgi:cytochrome c553